MTTSPDHFELSSDVVFTALNDDEAVLLHLRTQRYYSLNMTAKLIWVKLADGAHSQEVVNALVEQYDITNEGAIEQVQRFTSELLSEGLIQTKHPD